MPTAPERDVEIVPNPTTQTDVPSAPEVGEITCRVWEIEVGRYSNPEQACESNSDIAIATKIEQNAD